MYLKFKPDKFDSKPEFITFDKLYEITDEYFNAETQTQYYFFTDDSRYKDCQVIHNTDTDPIFELIDDGKEIV
jgi:hypothetical protein